MPLLDLLRATPEGSRNGHLHDAQAAVLVMVVMLSPIARMVTGISESARLWAHNRLVVELESVGRRKHSVKLFRANCRSQGTAAIKVSFGQAY